MSSIVRTLDGSNVEPLVIGSSEVLVGLALDVAGGQIYWTAPEEGVIYRASLDGSNVEPLVTGLDEPGVLALDVAGGQIYWTAPEEGVIYRASLDGSNVEALITGLNVPLGFGLGRSRRPDILDRPRGGYHLSCVFGRLQHRTPRHRTERATRHRPRPLKH